MAERPGAAGRRSSLDPAIWLARRLPFFYGWVVVAVGALGLLWSGPGQSAVVAVFMEPMLADLSLRRSDFAVAYFVGNLVAAGLMGPVGRLTDRLGGAVVMAGGAVGLGLACLSMSRADGFLALAVGFSALRLLVQGPLTLTGTTVVAQWFLRRRGRAQSLMQMGMTASFAVFPPATVVLVQQLTWRPAWQVIGVALLVVLVPPIVLLVRSQPEALGLRPDGDRAVLDRLAAAPYTEERAWTARQATRIPTFWLLSVGIAVMWMAGAGLNFHQVAILGDRGHTPAFAAGLFTVAAVLSIPATFAAGYLLDRFAPRPILLAALMLQAVTAWTLLGAEQTSLAVLYGALNGVMIGLTSVANAVVFAVYYGRRHLGSIRGVTMVINVAGSALGPLPLGLVRDALGSYDLALIGVGCLPLLVAVALFWARPPGPPPTA